MRTPGLASIGFLVMAFAIVGLTGMFATFGAPLPLERAMAREAALDDAAAAARRPDAAAALDALRPRLAESADAILPLSPDIDAKIAHERVAMRARFAADADGTTTRLRWLISVITIMGAAFGAAIMRISARVTG
jgi:hypothetical protein